MHMVLQKIGARESNLNYRVSLVELRPIVSVRAKEGYLIVITAHAPPGV
jgi:hypothetical protein